MSWPPADALVVSKYYWPEPIGSAPYMSAMAEHLAALGVRVQALTARPHYPAGRVWGSYLDGGLDEETRNGVAVRRVPTRVAGGRGALGRLAGDAGFLAQGLLALARRRVGRGAFVVSLSPSILSVLLGGVARRRGGRHVVVVHDIESGLAGGLGMLAGRWLPAVLARLERLLLDRTDLVLVLSEEMRAHLRAAGVRAPIEVLPIWVDTEGLQPLPRPEGDGFRVLYSGNFGRKQGLMQVVGMAAELARRGADIRVVLRGEGGQAAELKAAVERLGLGNVAFLPLLPAERLAEGLAEADLHLVPQDPRAAAFAVPSKVYAIMAVGRPFVATAEPGSQLWRLSDESQGFLCVPPDNPAALAEAVLTLAADRARCTEMGACGRRHVVARFARERVLADFVRLLGALEGPQWRQAAS